MARVARHPSCIFAVRATTSRDRRLGATWPHSPLALRSRRLAVAASRKREVRCLLPAAGAAPGMPRSPRAAALKTAGLGSATLSRLLTRDRPAPHRRMWSSAPTPRTPMQAITLAISQAARAVRRAPIAARIGAASLGGLHIAQRLRWPPQASHNFDRMSQTSRSHAEFTALSRAAFHVHHSESARSK